MNQLISRIQANKSNDQSVLECLNRKYHRKTPILQRMNLISMTINIQVPYPDKVTHLIKQSKESRDQAEAPGI